MLVLRPPDRCRSSSYFQLVPFYVVQDFRDFTGLSGVFLAGVVSASVSTVSSMVNSQAAVWYFDVVTPFFKVAGARLDCIIKTIAELQLFSVKFDCVEQNHVLRFVALLQMFMTVNAAITGPFAGLLILGLTAPFANAKGAGIVTLLMVAYQLAHMFVRVNAGVTEERMSVSLDYCAVNVTAVAAGNTSAALSAHTE
ncbi:hypothetical protein V5799_026608, partial [Amblyomma americanum]